MSALALNLGESWGLSFYKPPNLSLQFSSSKFLQSSIFDPVQEWQRESSLLLPMSLREGASDEKGKRHIWCTREAMNFDSKSLLCNQRDILDYLAKNDVKLPDEILVEWCPLKTDVTMARPLRGVRPSPNPGLEMKLPLTAFVRNVLSYFRVALS